MTDLEKMARAIYPDAFDIVGGHENCPDCLAAIEQVKQCARAALLAIREPSDSAINAGVRGLDDATVMYGDVLGAWEFVIDHILKGEP